MEEIAVTYPLEVLEKNKDAVRQTYKKEKGRLFNFIRKRVSAEADAEDILQDVFYQFTAAMQFDTIERAAAWLFKTAGNKITDWYRKKKPVPFQKISTSEESDIEVFIEESLKLENVLFGTSEDPDELYMRSTVWELLSEALDELPDEQREVFILHELEDKSFKEISEITGVPVNTLISRKHYAILFLREQLREIYNDFFEK